MNQLTALLLNISPAPLPPCARMVCGDDSGPVNVAGSSSRDDTMYQCLHCYRELFRADMHTRKDGNVGTTCKDCTRRNIVAREKREETTDPAKCARRLAKRSNCVITEARGEFLVWRKTVPKLVYVGKAASDTALFRLMRRVARCA